MVICGDFRSESNAVGRDKFMDQERIGRFIADLRKEKGMTQEHLAEILGVSSKTVSRWENGRNMPDYSILESLTGELGITVNELIHGERIVKDAIIREYDHNLVSVLKEYKRMKRIKNMILLFLLVLAGWTCWLLLVLGVPALFSAYAKVEISTSIEDYSRQIGPNAEKKFGSKWGLDESIFPEKIVQDMEVAEYKMVYYNPWDAQYLAYLVVDYEEDSYEKELVRLKEYPSTAYLGYYGVTGFEPYDLLAICANEEHGFVYALNDEENMRIIYVEIIFCNYFMDLDYKEYVKEAYLPEGFDATRKNAYRRRSEQSILSIILSKKTQQ